MFNLLRSVGRVFTSSGHPDERRTPDSSGASASPRAGQGPSVLDGLGRAPRRPSVEGRAKAAQDALNAWVAAAPPDENRARMLDRILDARGTGYLNLTSSGLRALPPKLDELCPQLERLRFCFQRPTEPFELGEWPRLLELTVTHGGLSRRLTLQNFGQLRELNLGFNQFDTTPDLKVLPLLEVLTLSYNCFRVPPDVTGCRHLKELRLSDNQLRAMPDARNLPNLRLLDVSRNCLTDVPPWLPDLPPGATVNLRGNPLSGDLMRLSCAGGKPAGAALVAQPGARCVDDALKTIRRNYRVLDHVGSQDGNEAPSAREASFHQAMQDTSRELDLAVDVSTLRYTDLAEYRTAFGGGTQRPQVGISGPSAHAEQLADVFHALPGGGFEKHFAFDSLNLFTEEDRTSACAEGAYAVRIRRQREDSISTWVENAHADRVRRTEAQRAEKADASIRSAVSSAVNWEWGRVESETRRKRTPNLLHAFGDAAGTAAYTRAAQSFPRDAPDQLVSDVYSALMSTPQGKTVRQSLIDTGNKYNEREHREFHQMLGNMAAADAGATLSDLDRLLRARAKRTTAASAERDAAEAARRGSARQAESDAQDAQVRERANQATRRTSLAGSTLGNEYEWGDRTSRKQREERELRELRGSAPPVPTDEPGWSRRRELRGESDAPRPRPVPVVRAQVPEDRSTPAATAGQGLGNPRGSGEAQASRPSPARGARTHGRQPAT